MNLREILFYDVIPLAEGSIKVYHFLLVTLVILTTRLLLWFVKRFIRKRVSNKKIEQGRGYAFYQILKYLVFIFTFAISLQIVGIKITLLLAGSAALLVGIGLGLQQLFNDLVSGIILLFEGTVTVGDIIEINGLVGRVHQINIRTSDIQTRDQIMIIVPNSKLVGDNVINWSHNRNLTRFNVSVGVAYGSDVDLVKTILVDAAKEHKDIMNTPEPVGRFLDFGESSLNFDILFWSFKMWEIENIKSDLRCIINKKFLQNHVTIPFPQRDLHIKSGNLMEPPQASTLKPK